MKYLKTDNTRQFLNRTGVQIAEPTEISTEYVTVVAMTIGNIFTVPICSSDAELAKLKALKTEKRWYQIAKNELPTINN